MAAEKNNKNEVLSRIIADLSKGGEDLPSRIDHLRDELKNMIGGEDTIFGKLRGLVESLRGVIPDEKLRYQAAVTAASTTSKLSRQEVIAALGGQVAELKILEKGLLSALSGGGDDLAEMEARAREIQVEREQLREQIGQLEDEEKVIRKSIAAREKETGQVGKAVGELIKDMGAEISGIKQKIETFTSDRPAPPPAASVGSIFPEEPAGGGRKSAATAPPAPQESPASSAERSTDDFLTEREAAQPDLSGDSIFPDENPGGGASTIEIGKVSSQPDTAGQKKCPMCGGRMDFNMIEKIWMCYSCAYEEKGDAVTAASPVAAEIGTSSVPASAPASAAPEDTAGQKKCPMCGGRMDFNMIEKLWMCYSCAYSEEGDAAPVSSQGNIEISGWSAPAGGGGSATTPDTAEQKKCPMCGGHMSFHIGKGTWICYSCAFEENEGIAPGTGPQEEKKKSEPKTGPSFAVSLADTTSALFNKPRKGTVSSRTQFMTKTKNCPVCSKKMNWYESEKTWRCPFCDYERRI